MRPDDADHTLRCSSRCATSPRRRLIRPFTFTDLVGTATTRVVDAPPSIGLIALFPTANCARAQSTCIRWFRRAPGDSIHENSHTAYRRRAILMQAGHGDRRRLARRDLHLTMMARWADIPTSTQRRLTVEETFARRAAQGRADAALASSSTIRGSDCGCCGAAPCCDICATKASTSRRRRIARWRCCRGCAARSGSPPLGPPERGSTRSTRSTRDTSSLRAPIAAASRSSFWCRARPTSPAPSPRRRTTCTAASTRTSSSSSRTT